jgi:hypothetical protein
LNWFQIGSEFEDEIFEGLRKSAKENQALNTVVLSGLKIKDLNLKTTGEIDFLIISLPLKSIIHIEAKRANTESSRSSAAKQLERGLSFFAKNCPFPSSENWTYIKMLTFGEVVKDICPNCKLFVLSADFIKTNKTQPVAEEIANQFILFWNTFEVCKGKIYMLHTSS